MQEISRAYQGRQDDVLQLQERITGLERKQINKMYQKENELPHDPNSLEMKKVSSQLHDAEQALMQQQLQYEKCYAEWTQRQTVLEQELQQAKLMHTTSDTMFDTNMTKQTARLEAKLRDQLGRKDKVVRALSDAVKQLGAPIMVHVIMQNLA
jgi:hypothetical protein